MFIFKLSEYTISASLFTCTVLTYKRNLFFLFNLSCAGKVVGWFNQHHVTHKNELAHLRIRKPERVKIAGLLAAGIPLADILARVREWGGSERLQPYHLIKKKDLYNISKEFRIAKEHQLHSNDAESVAIWVERNKNQVRFVKWQGEGSTEGGALKMEDFMLVLMSEAQLAALNKFGGPLREVAMDSTHGTNAYNFQLTTLMVIDDHGEGYPAAFCYSNRVDEQAMSVFLSSVKGVLGHAIEEVILMTDDAESYANAWTSVMGPPAHRLLCVWHVDRAWRKNLSKIRGDGLLKANVYKTLRALLEITDAESFKERLQSFLSTAAEDSRTAEFAVYFSREYASRPNLWAYSFRIGLRVHHNMHLEALHRVLKHVHLQGRKVRRMDLSVAALMRLMREKDCDRLLKMHRGKWTKQLLGIRQRHRKSLAMQSTTVTCIAEDESYAVSASHGSEVYLVEQVDEPPHKPSDCALNCSHCNVCVHSFVCTCLDSGLRTTICKHVHLVISRCEPTLRSVAPVDCELLLPLTYEAEEIEEDEFSSGEQQVVFNILNQY